MSAQEFQGVAIAWITAIGIVAGAAITAVVALFQKIAALRQAVKDANQRMDDHSRRITVNSQAATDLALLIEPTKKS